MLGYLFPVCGESMVFIPRCCALDTAEASHPSWLLNYRCSSIASIAVTPLCHLVASSMSSVSKKKLSRRLGGGGSRITKKQVQSIPFIKSSRRPTPTTTFTFARHHRLVFFGFGFSLLFCCLISMPALHHIC